jgi:hypothetical protein
MRASALRRIGENSPNVEWHGRCLIVGMSNEPRGSSNRSNLSALFGSEQERATQSLRRQARSLEARSFRCMQVDDCAGSGPLPTPHFVFFLDDGRAIAWFDESHPYVVHPSFPDLCSMHGLRPAVVRAA